MKKPRCSSAPVRRHPENSSNPPKPPKFKLDLSSLADPKGAGQTSRASSFHIAPHPPSNRPTYSSSFRVAKYNQSDSSKNSNTSASYSNFDKLLGEVDSLLETTREVRGLGSESDKDGDKQKEKEKDEKSNGGYPPPTPATERNRARPQSARTPRTFAPATSAQTIALNRARELGLDIQSLTTVRGFSWDKLQETIKQEIDRTSEPFFLHTSHSFSHSPSTPAPPPPPPQPTVVLTLSTSATATPAESSKPQVSSSTVISIFPTRVSISSNQDDGQSPSSGTSATPVDPPALPSSRLFMAIQREKSALSIDTNNVELTTSPSPPNVPPPPLSAQNATLSARSSQPSSARSRSTPRERSGKIDYVARNIQEMSQMTRDKKIKKIQEQSVDHQQRLAEAVQMKLANDIKDYKRTLKMFSVSQAKLDRREEVIAEEKAKEHRRSLQYLASRWAVLIVHLRLKARLSRHWKEAREYRKRVLGLLETKKLAEDVSVHSMEDLVNAMGRYWKIFARYIERFRRRRALRVIKSFLGALKSNGKFFCLVWRFRMCGLALDRVLDRFFLRRRALAQLLTLQYKEVESELIDAYITAKTNPPTLSKSPPPIEIPPVPVSSVSAASPTFGSAPPATPRPSSAPSPQGRRPFVGNILTPTSSSAQPQPLLLSPRVSRATPSTAVEKSSVSTVIPTTPVATPLKVPKMVLTIVTTDYPSTSSLASPMPRSPSLFSPTRSPRRISAAQLAFFAFQKGSEPTIQGGRSRSLSHLASFRNPKTRERLTLAAPTQAWLKSAVVDSNSLRKRKPKVFRTIRPIVTQPVKFSKWMKDHDQTNLDFLFGAANNTNMCPFLKPLFVKGEDGVSGSGFSNDSLRNSVEVSAEMQGQVLEMIRRDLLKFEKRPDSAPTPLLMSPRHRAVQPKKKLWTGSAKAGLRAKVSKLNPFPFPLHLRPPLVDTTHFAYTFSIDCYTSNLGPLGNSVKSPYEASQTSLGSLYQLYDASKAATEDGLKCIVLVQRTMSFVRHTLLNQIMMERRKCHAKQMMQYQEQKKSFPQRVKVRRFMMPSYAKDFLPHLTCPERPHFPIFLPHDQMVDLVTRGLVITLQALERVFAQADAENVDVYDKFSFVRECIEELLVADKECETEHPLCGGLFPTTKK